ncbi:MAG: alginate O-acetyltransferase complex protein AlgI [Acidimicrobiaceae bacterium]|nr:alginate O-acetyltransferase complex protein AlgI [Acidimicrobiaceae bacterium]
MLFTSPAFLFSFLPVVLLGFHILRAFGRNILLVAWLLAASMVFYAWWSPYFLLLLIASMLANYWIGYAIQHADGPPRKVLFTMGILGNLALLAYFKYADFFLDTLNTVAKSDLPLLHIILPLGISFFTFQKIAYLADIHARHARTRRLADFALFVFFFPQLIAGPIVHHSEVMPQFRLLGREEAHDRAKSRALAWENSAVGLTIFLIGLVKKVVIADQIARYVSPIFAAASHEPAVGFVLAWQAALGYTVQLYFDFSGYSDMAIGLARLFGVRLPANFNSPYAALSIVEFWRRWHMTLSRFLRDYVYIPLGGNRHGPARRYINLLATMVLGGFWHGAGWTFILWGALHGIYLLIAHAWESLARVRLPAPLAWIITLLAVIVAWVIFRAPDLQSAGVIFAGMIGMQGLHHPIANVAEAPAVILISAALLAVSAILPNTQQIMRAYRPVLGPVPPAKIAVQWYPAIRFAALGGVAAVAVMLLSWETSEFLYFQF